MLSLAGPNKTAQYQFNSSTVLKKRQDLIPYQIIADPDSPEVKDLNGRGSEH